jgi:hypothetical protein
MDKRTSIRNNSLDAIVIFNNHRYAISDIGGSHMSLSHQWHIRDY